MMKLSSWFAVLGCLVIVGCGSNPPADSGAATKTEPTTPAETKPTTTADATKPAQTGPGLKELKFRVKSPGDSLVQGIFIKSQPKVENGDMVTAQYTGKLKNGTVFDSNWPKSKTDQPDPLTFVIGRDVIQGWSEGMLGMKIGEVREIDIPAAMAYGAADQGNIPPNSDLYFTIKVLDIVKPGEEHIYDFKDVQVGSGPAAKEGSTITIQYTGTLVNGRQFDTNIGNGKKPYPVKLGGNVVIPGFDYALRGMKAGGTRLMRIPPAIAYQTKNVPGIPANSTLVFKVKAVSVQ